MAICNDYSGLASAGPALSLQRFYSIAVGEARQAGVKHINTTKPSNLDP